MCYTCRFKSPIGYLEKKLMTMHTSYYKLVHT